MPRIGPTPARQHRPPSGNVALTLGAVLGLGVVLPLECAAAEAAAPRDFDIPAARATVTLRTFAVQSGVQTLYTPEATAGVTTRAVKGRLSPKAAIDRMLVGTPLRAQQDPQSGAIAIVTGDGHSARAALAPAAGAPSPGTPPTPTATMHSRNLFATVLGWLAFTATSPVSGQTPEPGAGEGDPVQLSDFVVSTTTDRGYRATNSISASRTNIAIREVPIFLQVVTEELIADMGAFQLEDYTRYIPGVSPLVGNNLVMRGFAATNFIDGLPDNGRADDSVRVARVEVLKGATAVLYGVSQPGGIVNVITRRPQFKNATSIKQFAGSFGMARTELDAQTALGSAKQLGVRLLGAYSVNDTYGYIDDWREERTFLNPTATWRIGPGTTLDVRYEYANRNGSPFGQVLRYNVAPSFPAAKEFGPRLNYRGPNSFSDSESHAAHVELVHAINSSWTFRSAFAGYTSESLLVQAAAVGRIAANGFSQPVRATGNEGEGEGFFNQTEIVGSLKIGPTRHKLLFGINYTETETDTLQRLNPRQVVIDLRTLPGFKTPVGTYPNDFTTLQTDSALTNQVRSAYLSDQIHFAQDRGLIMTGVRYDRLRAVTENRRSGTRQIVESSKYSPQIGVSYRVADPVTLFAVMSRSLSPNTGLDRFGNGFPPQEGEGYDLGVKTELLDGRISTTSSIFWLERRNIPRNSPFVPGEIQYLVLSGAEESYGAEIDFNASIRDGWQVVGGYSYVRGEVTSNDDQPERVGTRLQGAPQHHATLWNKFTVMQGQLRGLSASLGLIYVGERSLGQTGQIFTPSYTRVDLALQYEAKVGQRPVTFQFNVRNVTDELYENEQASWGTPRAYVGSVRVRF